jgi:hypothetical protein
MRRIAVALAAVAVALPGTAAAKELDSATICGASGCRTIAQPPESLASGEDGISDAIPAPGAFYTVELSVSSGGEPDSWRVYWIPDAETVAFRDESGRTTFERLSGAPLAAFRTATSGLEPFAGPVVSGATVDGRPVSDPGSYLELFGRPTQVDAVPYEADWVPIEIRSRRPSPWTNAVLLVYSPSAEIVEAGGTTFVKLSRAEVEAVEAGAPFPLGDDGSILLPLAVGVAVALFAALALAVGVRTARRSARRQPLHP